MLVIFASCCPVKTIWLDEVSHAREKQVMMRCHLVGLASSVHGLCEITKLCKKKNSLEVTHD